MGHTLFCTILFHHNVSHATYLFLTFFFNCLRTWLYAACCIHQVSEGGGGKVSYLVSYTFQAISGRLNGEKRDIMREFNILCQRYPAMKLQPHLVQMKEGTTMIRR